VYNSLCFDGTNDYLIVTNEAEVNFIGACTNGGAESFTIDAWIKPSPAGGGNAVLLDKEVENVNNHVVYGRGYSLVLLQVSSQQQVGFFIKDGAHDDWYAANTASLSDGQWHFVAVIVTRCESGQSLGTFYVDGRVAGTFADPGLGDLNNTSVLYIGRGGPISTYGVDSYMGCLDELEFFKRALSTNELAAIYNAGAFGKCRPACPPSPPAPVIEASPTNGVGPLNVNFALFTAPCGLKIANATVNFGDGNITNVVYPGDPILHTYNPGTWTVTAVSTDSGGNTYTNIQPNLVTVQTPFQAWQLQYFSCTNNGSLCGQAAPNADPYGKGISNFNQFLLGLNPTNPASLFRILSLVPQSNDLMITWTAGGGPTNVVQATGGTVNGGYSNNFTDISGPIPIPGSGDTTNTYPDVGGATNRPSRYYRIRLGP
jgi:hypothetical protein